MSLAEDVRSAIHCLESNVNAFLLLDMGLDNADLFLDAIVMDFFDPPPYLLVIDEFSSSSERISVLNRGADVCLEKPVNAEEVFAVINTVLRRAGRMQGKKIELVVC